MEWIANLHPLVIHFPIVLFLIYTVFEISGFIFKKEFMNEAAFILLIFGVLSGLIAVITGNQAMEIAYRLRIAPDKILEIHEEFATTTLLYFFAILIFRTYFVIKKKLVGAVKIFIIILSLVGCILVYITGMYGGRLVFKYGVGTEVVKQSFQEYTDKR